MQAAPATQAWPDGLLLAYYGDDFTGSTDVMEAFTDDAVPTVLFLRFVLHDMTFHREIVGTSGNARIIHAIASGKPQQAERAVRERLTRANALYRQLNGLPATAAAAAAT